MGDVGQADGDPEGLGDAEDGAFEAAARRCLRAVGAL